MKRPATLILFAVFLASGCSDTSTVAPDLADGEVTFSTAYEANPGSMGQIFQTLDLFGVGAPIGDFVCVLFEDFEKDPNPDWIRSQMDQTPTMEHWVAAPGYLVVLNFGDPDLPFLVSGQAHGGFNVQYDKNGDFRRANYHANGQLTDGEGYTYAVNCKDEVSAEGRGSSFVKIKKTSKKPVAVEPI
jgi:hypothetical protein